MKLQSRVQTPLKSWLFQASIPYCLNCVHNCEDHSSLDLFDFIKILPKINIKKCEKRHSEERRDPGRESGEEIVWKQMGVLFNPRIRKGLKAESCRTWSPQQGLVVSKVELWYIGFELRRVFYFSLKTTGYPSLKFANTILKCVKKLGNQRKRSIVPLYIICSRFLSNLTLLTPRNTFCACLYQCHAIDDKNDEGRQDWEPC